MTWSDFPWSAAVAIALAIIALTMLALETRLRGSFASVKDVDGIGRKVERNTGLYVALDDRVGDLEEKVSVVEERQTQQWERISQQMNQTATTIRDVTKELKEISRMQQEHALRLERIAKGGQ